ncbi:MAG: hypothetical protein MRY64_05850 [Hyphomonadaceae bacterium]|nr:hypothetical protein [Hyphomonadaceae bacterium]
MAKILNYRQPSDGKKPREEIREGTADLVMMPNSRVRDVLQILKNIRRLERENPDKDLKDLLR